MVLYHATRETKQTSARLLDYVHKYLGQKKNDT